MRIPRVWDKGIPGYAMWSNVSDPLLVAPYKWKWQGMQRDRTPYFRSDGSNGPPFRRRDDIHGLPEHPQDLAIFPWPPEDLDR